MSGQVYGDTGLGSALKGWKFRCESKQSGHFVLLLLLTITLSSIVTAQGPPPGGPPGRGPGGGPGRGPAGGPGGGNQERELVEQFDGDKDGRLNAAERAQAAEFIRTNAQEQGGRFGRGGGPRGGRGPGGPPGGGRRGRGASRPPATPGIQLSPRDVEQFPNAPLYDPSILRTFFIQFENPEWESELVAFNNTDVEVPAKVRVDGKVYSDVGIHFRGNSSFRVGDGYKRSLNLSFDFVHEEQSVKGYRTLNFLNANADPTFLHTVLSLHIARQYIPAPKANLVRVVINGENWGIYANQQQFNKDFLKDNFNTTKGTRWKVPQGGAGGIGAFQYVDEDPNSYRGVFQIKSKDKPQAWDALIGLARVLSITPSAELEAALTPVLDIDSYLHFLALDNVLVSGDGFWTRGADYSLYLHPDGRFRLILYDANEMFSTGGGRRGRGPGGGGSYSGGTGVNLEPLAGLSDKSKPIVERVLSVPSLRAKYLDIVREIALNSLDWRKVGPLVKQYRELIAEDVNRDTRKLFSTEQFLSGTADAPIQGSLRSFFDGRRAAVLKMTAELANQ